jgi:hypothetical protein
VAHCQLLVAAEAHCHEPLLYEGGQEHHRAALMEIFARVRLGWGVWQAFKRIYKLAEEDRTN